MKIAAIAPSSSRASAPIRRARPTFGPLRAILLPTSILLLATALRVFGLDRVPPGLFYDEAANGIDALGVLGGAHPIFFVGDQGREPLHIYLQAVTFALIGPSPLALRLPSAALGILGVAATYSLFRAFGGRLVGLVGAFLLAVSFWQLDLSRIAFRTIDLPLFTALAVFCLWKGLRTGRVPPFALAGLFLGLTMYTYIPARVAPPILALWIVIVALVPSWRKASLGRVILGGALLLLVASVVAAPLGYYFALHPYDFLERVRNASGAGGATRASEIIAAYGQSVRAVIWSGDVNPRHDLLGRPLIDVPLVALGAAGVLIGLRRRDPATIFCLLWCGAMIAPAALSDAPAHALRLAGVLPFALYFPARAVADLRLVRHPALRRAAMIAAATVLLGGAVLTTRDYFVVWAVRPEVAHYFEADLLRPLALLNQIPPGQEVFATSNVYEGQQIPLRFVPTSRDDVRGFKGPMAFVVPATPRPVYYLYGSEFEPTGGIPFADHLTRLAVSHDPSGRVDGELLRMDPPLVAPVPTHPVPARIGQAIEVRGGDVPPTVHPGERFRVALYWTVREAAPPGDWELFAHLVDRQQSQLLAQDYNDGLPPTEWRVGDQVVSWLNLRVPDNASAGVVDVDFGVLESQTGQRLDVTMPDGRTAGNAIIVGPLRIDRPSVLPPPRFPLNARFGPAMVLTGYDLDPQSGGAQTLRLHWRATGPADHDYTVFVHALDASGTVIAGADSQPAGGTLPTSTWSTGESYLDLHELQFPPNAKPARLEVGVYLLSTGQRLPATNASGKSMGDTVTIPE